MGKDYDLPCDKCCDFIAKFLADLGKRQETYTARVALYNAGGRIRRQDF